MQHINYLAECMYLLVEQKGGKIFRELKWTCLDRNYSNLKLQIDFHFGLFSYDNFGITNIMT